MRRTTAALMMIALVLSLSGCGPKWGFASVEDMEDRFDDDQEQLEALVALAEDDVGIEVSEYTAGGRLSGLSDARADRYSALMEEVGAVTVQSWGDQVDILIGAEGLAVSGAEWGYSWCSAPPSPVVQRDVIDTWNEPLSWFYHLEGDWYAFEYHF
jgi:hypothetical protein